MDGNHARETIEKDTTNTYSCPDLNDVLFFLKIFFIIKYFNNFKSWNYETTLCGICVVVGDAVVVRSSKAQILYCKQKA